MTVQKSYHKDIKLLCHNHKDIKLPCHNHKDKKYKKGMSSVFIS